MTSNPAMILASETHHMTSAAGREYRVSVALPLGYQSGPSEDWPFHDSPKRWPTVYVLDGNWYFGMVVDMIRPMSWCGGTTDAIVVGIGYPESADPNRILPHRIHPPQSGSDADTRSSRGKVNGRALFPRCAHGWRT